MTGAQGEGITVADTVRWLHGDGLKRLTGMGGRLSSPIAAYTVEVATGAVTAYPATGVGLGSDTLTLTADDLPYPTGTAGRLVVVGVTSTEAVLVLDLSTTLEVAVNGERAEGPARSWALQLLLNPDLRLTTNGSSLSIGTSPRYQYRFTPGGGTTQITVDDQRTSITSISVNAATDGPDHLDVAADGSGEVYLGARYWRLKQVLSIDDESWTALAQAFDSSAATTIGGTA